MILERCGKGDDGDKQNKEKKGNTDDWTLVEKNGKRGERYTALGDVKLSNKFEILCSNDDDDDDAETDDDDSEHDLIGFNLTRLDSTATTTTITTTTTTRRAKPNKKQRAKRKLERQSANMFELGQMKMSKGSLGHLFDGEEGREQQDKMKLVEKIGLV